jgi:hypothetical protein
MGGHISVAFSVLADWSEVENLAAAKMRPTGKLLYLSMTRERPVTVVLDHPEIALATHWLASHLLTRHSLIVPNPRTDDPAEGRGAVVETIRSRGPLELAIESDPALAARMLHYGVPTMLVSEPFYARPEFRPDAEKTVSPWANIVSELDAQRTMLAEDSRIKGESHGDRFE